MKRGVNIVILMLIVAGTLLVHAQSLSHQQALSLAQQTLAHKGIHLDKGMYPVDCKSTGKSLPFYIFTGNNHTVITSANKQQPVVLGYCEQGNFDQATAPPAMLEWLDNIASNGILRMENEQISAQSPLLKTLWGQLKPYNMMCPVIDPIDSTRAATGSVATALAQIVYYNKWPRNLTENISSYISPSLQEIIPEYNHLDYPPLGLINLAYTSPHDSTALPVASLMKACGQAVKTDYGYSSGARLSSIPEGIVQFLQYQSSAHYVQQRDFTDEQWVQMIIDELMQRRPVMYRGSKRGGEGHAFVIDGVDSNGLFHINWGWDGVSNGYYALPALMPEIDVTRDESNDHKGYTHDAAMIVGIVPNNNELYPHMDADNRLTISQLSIGSTQVSRHDDTTDFSPVSVTMRYSNHGATPIAFDAGIALCDTRGTIIKVLSTKPINLLIPEYGTTITQDLHITANIQPGNYTLRAVSREKGNNKWTLCIGSLLNYVDVSISNKSMHLGLSGNSNPAQYQVDKITTSGAMQALRPVNVNIALTNISPSSHGNIYLTVNGIVCNEAQTFLAAGASGEVVMQFTPTTAGNYSIGIAADMTGHTQLASTTVNITPAQHNNIQIDNLTVHNATLDRTINSGTLDLSCKVTNNNHTPYHDIIIAELYRISPDGNDKRINKQIAEVNIAPNMATDINYHFELLHGPLDYYVELSYIDTGKPASALITDYYTVLGDYKIGDLDANRVIDISDLNLLISAILLHKGADYCDGRADLNFDGSLDISDLDYLINILLKII